MMLRFRIVTGLLAMSMAIPCAAQLANDDKVFDLLDLATRFKVNYAGADWKYQEFGVDLFNLNPWIARIQQTSNDLEYLDLLTQYVAQLNDSHVSIRWPMSFQAYLGFSADVYDGRVLLDSISPTLVPASLFPFQQGDELVSVDGQSAANWIVTLRPFGFSSSPRASARSAAALITLRPQSVLSDAGLTPDTAQVVVNRASTGAVETYTMPWYKTGIAVNTLRPCAAMEGLPPATEFEPKGKAAVSASPPSTQARLPDERTANIANMGAQTPLFLVPSTFVTRLGAWSAFTGVNSPYFFSGIWTANGARIGYVRIPNFSPADSDAAIAQFQQEMSALRPLTDGLVVDVMHNPGGSVQYAEALIQSLIPARFLTMGFEVRPSLSWIQFFSDELKYSTTAKAPAGVLANLKGQLAQVMDGYATGTARTAPLSLNGSGSLALDPASGAYDKPMIVVTDELSASAAEMFTAILQDNGRAMVVGMATMGAGGTVQDMDAGVCTEGTLSVTVSLMHRSSQVNPPNASPTFYVENVGVLPDVIIDYMTVDNLHQLGTPFVNQITNAIVQQIQSKQQQ